MTQLTILSESERRLFDRPPILNNEERRLYFNVTPEVRTALARIETPAYKVGFLLQLGYFKANARFYQAPLFRGRDVDYVQRLLTLDAVDLSTYADTIPRRHRRRIRSLLNWQNVDAAAREELVTQANRYVANQEYPKRIFHGLIDLCWKRQWVIPSYFELNSIITDSFNAADRDLLGAVESALTIHQTEHLEALLSPIQKTPKAGSPAALTRLKRIDQSLKAGDIKRSMQTLALFRDHFFSVESALAILPLSDKATDYYATWLALADHQQLSQFPNRHKAYLHLLAFIKHQFYQRQDAAIDILLKTVSLACNTAKKQLNQQSQAQKGKRDLAIQALRQAQLSASEFAGGVVSITQAPNATPHEKYYKIETLVDDYLASIDADSMARIDTLAHDISNDLKHVPYYQLLASLSAKSQRRVADVVRTVTFDAESSSEDLISAIDHFKRTNGRLGSHPPDQFLTQDEFKAVYEGDAINTPLYKILLFIHMANGIRSGHLNVRHSYRYRAIQDYLINPAEWSANKEMILKETDLSQFANCEQTLEALKVRLHERYCSVNENFLQRENPYMRIREDGRYNVRTPKTDYDTHSFISTTLMGQGIVPILQLLKSVDKACDFTSTFKHFSTKHSKMKPSAETLMAGLIAQGCNIGLSKLANISTGLDSDALRNTVNWYFDHDNLRAANRKITAIISELALANNYLHQPPSLHSSSDGRKVNVAVDCLHANYSFKYFGKGMGVTDYTFIDERQVLFHNTLFSASDREAPYVIDGLLDNQVPEGHVHSTDTHGFSEQIFCITHLMGVAFAPRLANLPKQRLYAFSARKSFQKKGYALLPSRTINRKLIVSQWDDVLRFMATIKTRHTTASQLFKRLSSYAKDHPLYKALKEFGRIIKSQFILSYYEDVELRQQIQMQLSRVEQANKFSAAVFFDNDHAFQDGTLNQQETAIMCKLILQNAIILWNYLSLSEHIINTPDVEEQQEIISAIRKGSVITWAHVNLHGEYTFTPPSANDEVFDIETIKAFQIN